MNSPLRSKPLSAASDFTFPAGSSVKNPKKAARPSAPPQEAFTTADETSSEPKTSKTPSKDTAKWSDEELARVFDELIFSGEYRETVSMKGGRLTVEFRNRSSKETDAVTLELDSMQLGLMSTYNQVRSVLQLKQSLCSINGKDLASMDQQGRSDFIDKLPSTTIGLLLGALNDFDMKVYLACKDPEVNF